MGFALDSAVLIALATAIFRILTWPAANLLTGDEAQPVKRERQGDWDRLKQLALSLGLPGVEETTSWGQPTLKAHGKLWVWWKRTFDDERSHRLASEGASYDEG
jgi:hypothetical protein